MLIPYLYTHHIATWEFVAEQIVFLVPTFAIFFCWELTHTLHRVCVPTYTMFNSSFLFFTQLQCCTFYTCFLVCCVCHYSFIGCICMLSYISHVVLVQSLMTELFVCSCSADHEQQFSHIIFRMCYLNCCSKRACYRVCALYYAYVQMAEICSTWHGYTFVT